MNLHPLDYAIIVIYFPMVLGIGFYLKKYTQSGENLFEEARKRLLQSGTKRVYLEVRQSNKSAQGLYFSAGFGLHSMRKDYYRNPPEDAYVLSLQL